MNVSRYSVKTTVALILFVVMSFMLAPWAYAFFEKDYENTLGARPYGMGGAFSAVADEAAGIHYNPAGLSFLGNQEATLTLSPLQSGGIYSGSIAYVLPTNELGAAGLSYRRDHALTGDGPSQNRLTLSYAYQLRDLIKELPSPNNLSLGLSLKWLRTDSSKDGLKDGDGVAFSLGSIYTLPIPQEYGKGVGVGLTVDDLAFYRNKGSISQDVPWTLRLGTSYSPEDVSLIALDLSYNSGRNVPVAVFVGGERWFFGNILGLRGGYNYERLDSLDSYFGLAALGTTLKAEEWKLDYGLGFSTATLKTSHRFSISYIWGGRLSLLTGSE